MYGENGRIGLIIPANNSVLEPELWSVAPAGISFHSTRLLVGDDVTEDAVRLMEEQVDRAAAALMATGVDVIVYADMVTTFIMERGWNEQKTAAIARRSGVPCVSAGTALRDACNAMGIRRFCLGTPYPAGIHAAAVAYFRESGFDVVSDATLDISKGSEVPKVSADVLSSFVRSFSADDAHAVVLLATDLPTFRSIAALEREIGIPVLTSNQTILRAALQAVGCETKFTDLGTLLCASQTPETRL